eukprot:PhM_4_TR13943/c0_g1_i1/m.100711
MGAACCLRRGHGHQRHRRRCIQLVHREEVPLMCRRLRQDRDVAADAVHDGRHARDGTQRHVGSAAGRDRVDTDTEEGAARVAVHEVVRVRRGQHGGVELATFLAQQHCKVVVVVVALSHHRRVAVCPAHDHHALVVASCYGCESRRDRARGGSGGSGLGIVGAGRELLPPVVAVRLRWGPRHLTDGNDGGALIRRGITATTTGHRRRRPSPQFIHVHARHVALHRHSALVFRAGHVLEPDQPVALALQVLQLWRRQAAAGGDGRELAQWHGVAGVVREARRQRFVHGLVAVAHAAPVLEVRPQAARHVVRGPELPIHEQRLKVRERHLLRGVTFCDPHHAGVGVVPNVLVGGVQTHLLHRDDGAGAVHDVLHLRRAVRHLEVALRRQQHLVLLGEAAEQVHVAAVPLPRDHEQRTAAATGPAGRELEGLAARAGRGRESGPREVFAGAELLLGELDVDTAVHRRVSLVLRQLVQCLRHEEEELLPHAELCQRELLLLGHAERLVRQRRLRLIHDSALLGAVVVELALAAGVPATAPSLREAVLVFLVGPIPVVTVRVVLRSIRTSVRGCSAAQRTDEVSLLHVRTLELAQCAVHAGVQLVPHGRARAVVAEVHTLPALRLPDEHLLQSPQTLAVGRLELALHGLHPLVVGAQEHLRRHLLVPQRLEHVLGTLPAHAGRAHATHLAADGVVRHAALGVGFVAPFEGDVVPNLVERLAVAVAVAGVVVVLQLDQHVELLLLQRLLQHAVQLVAVQVADVLPEQLRVVELDRVDEQRHAVDLGQRCRGIVLIVAVAFVGVVGVVVCPCGCSVALEPVAHEAHGGVDVGAVLWDRAVEQLVQRRLHLGQVGAQVRLQTHQGRLDRQGVVGRPRHARRFLFQQLFVACLAGHACA